MRLPSSRFYGLTLRQGQGDFSLAVDVPGPCVGRWVENIDHKYFKTGYDHKNRGSGTRGAQHPLEYGCAGFECYPDLREDMAEAGSSRSIREGRVT
jgi:hypothetical protein